MSLSKGTFPSIVNRCVDTARPVKVICVGAGVSGILAAIKLPQQVEKLDLVIYDKNEELGGTWFENRYPGCACDIPAHCYQLSFESNPAWSQYYATAPEILDYWRAVADKYDARKYMKLNTEVVEARWSEEGATWTVTLRDVTTGNVFHDSADVFITAVGVLNQWKWPDLPGLNDFQGQLLHSAAWDSSFDYKSKRLAVIGAGSSGIQIVPNVQPDVSRIDHYVRGRTWVSTGIAAEEVSKRTGGGSNFSFSQDEIQHWTENPEAYLEFRRALEHELQSGHPVTIRGSEEQKGARIAFTKLMQERLSKKPEIAEHLIPEFSPVCKRLTPGPGYLESLTQPNVDVIFDPITRITSTGIETADGKVREVDAIVCATGFDTSWKNRFPIYGRDGLKLGTKWQKFPSNYLSLATDDFPNMFMSLGPNSAQGAGNLLVLIEKVAEYTAQCIRKMQSEHIRTMTAKASSVEKFGTFCDKYFETTVFSEECSSWYKAGSRGRVSALWPGSSLHAIKVLERPRWEDYEYSYLDNDEFGWFGDGWSERDRSESSDRAYYLTPDQVGVVAPAKVTPGTEQRVGIEEPYGGSALRMGKGEISGQSRL